MSDLLIRRALRVVALLIAIMAVIDPPVTSRRTVKPVVVVSALDSARDNRRADDVARTIDKRFTVVRSPIAGASAAVLVGDRLPDGDEDFPTPSFTVVSDSASAIVAIERLDAPASAPLDARIPVVAHVATRGAVDRTLELTLRVASSVVERTTRRLGRGDTALAIPLTFIAPARGANVVRVSAAIRGSDGTVIADAVVDVADRRWAVLFHDARPSWTSTFVRRSVERDSRFVVASRVVTSRNVSTRVGLSPASLSDPTALSSFDVVVVGAPDALSTADVTGLEAFMRRRGGSVVLLLDGPKAGPYDRLTDVSSWSTHRGSPLTLALSHHDSASLRAGDVVWPSVLPAGATAIADEERPAVWESPVGAGRLVVSGALDAWRYRDPSSSGFERFWRLVIAEAAATTPPPVTVALSPTTAKPGELVDVGAVVRDAALDPAVSNSSASRAVRASVAAMLEPRTNVRLWPGADVGHFAGAVRAPKETGIYRIAVATDAGSATVPLVVAADARLAAPSSRALSSAWAASHGGRTFGVAEIGGLPAALSAAIRPPSQLVTWHPLRSAWWIVAFVLALSGEWWLRRRRGLR